MGFFTAETRVVEIDSENRVTIRKLTNGQQKRALSQATRAQVTADGQETITVDPFVIQMEHQKACIVAWEGPGFEGLPVTPANIEALPSEVSDALDKAIGELNKGLSETEKN
jgi:hypothetical protein